MTVALAGCALAPTSQAPPPLDLPPASAAVANPQELSRWWTVFGDPTLDKLVDEGLANNLDVRAAIARIDSARAQLKLVERGLYPNLDLNAGATRSRATDAGAFKQPGVPLYTNDFRIALQASYEADFWGKYRGATRAAQSDLIASQYAREVVHTVVAADVARLYFNLLAADAQLGLLEDTLKTREQSVELQTDRRQGGIIGDYELGTAQAERDAVRADIGGEATGRRIESALAVLLGRSPRDVFTPQVARNVAMAWGTAVPSIPGGLSSELLARRPDIRQAEAQIAPPACADVRARSILPVDRADRRARRGTEAASLRDLFSAPALDLEWGRR